MATHVVTSLTAPDTKITRQADAYISRQHNFLASYNSLEHFICDMDEDENLAANVGQALAHHMLSY